MPKDLNLTRLSSTLTAKERAKLIIALFLKGLGELSDAEYEQKGADCTLSTDAEIKQLVSSVPPDQIREYNFYHKLHAFVIGDVLRDINKAVLCLGLLDGRIERFYRDMTFAPFIYQAIEFLKRQPMLVTRAEYEEVLARARAQAREQVLELEGPHNLAEQEAFARLLQSGALRDWQGEDEEPLLDDWLGYLERYGKSQDELIQAAVTDIKMGIASYLRDKRLTGKGQLWQDYERYAGLSDEKLAALVRKERSEDLAIPSQEQVQQWHNAVEAERQRLLRAVQDGALKWGKRMKPDYNRDKRQWVDREVEGVLAGSYYDWPLRCQKFAGEEGATTCWHPLAEDCIQLTYYKGKLTTPSEQINQGTDWYPVAIATPHSAAFDPFTSPEATNRRTEELMKFLTILLPVQVKSKLLQDPTILRLKPYVKASLQTFVKEVHETISRIHTHIALIEAIETKHFDGMPVVSRDAKHPLGESARALLVIDELVSQHNEQLRALVSTFNKLDRGLREFTFPDLDKFLLNPRPTVDQEWIARQLALAEDCAS